jgi:two-component system, NtrC family, sensor histidine kinase HydH
MRLGIRTGADESLAVRLAWLTALRVIVLTLFLVVTTAVYLRGFRSGGFSSMFALMTVAAAYGAAVVYAVALRFGRALKTVAYAQLITDQLTWTALVYVTGGVNSGATSLYGLTCLSGAILLGLPGALTAFASGAVALLALTSSLIDRRLLPPVDQPGDAYQLDWSHASYPLLVNLLAIGVVTALASYLAERLRTTGGRLEIATERAEKAEHLAALGRLAAGLAHEIRNPLGSIRGSIELLRSGESLSEEDRRLCELIERETQRLNDLVGDMLDLSRPRAPQPEAIDLVPIARDVVMLASQSGRGADVGVRYQGVERLLVMADAGQLRQVVWNLVRNAIQASSAGDEVVVRVSGPVDGAMAELSIVDQGPGIPTDARDRLFDAFYTTRSHGTGVGLAVVKRVIDAHGFTIEVDTVAGEGTTFKVSLPALRDNAVPATGSRDTAADPAEGPTESLAPEGSAARS